MRPLFAIVLWMMAGCGSCSVIFCAMAAHAQRIVGFSDAPKTAGHVRFDDAPITVPAGRATFVELRFHVDPGFHVNSHKPASELLIPTLLTFENDSTTRTLHTEYPKGEAFKLEIASGEILDVYQGEFRVRVQLVAAKGETVLHGSLHYQACDKAACFPPRTLPVSLTVIGE